MTGRWANEDGERGDETTAVPLTKSDRSEAFDPTPWPSLGLAAPHTLLSQRSFLALPWEEIVGGRCTLT